MNESDCRFLKPDGECIIGLIASPSKFVEVRIDQLNMGGVPWTSSVTSKWIPSCSVKDDPKEQTKCDCFVPKQQVNTREWLINFSEG